ncbi:MAG TPA: TRAP transporter small permease [Burkholderiales bacterium]|jgi:TRAP-type C4-dicarboxylate transport system permease small subunit
MRDQYRKAMQWLYLACIALSGIAMVVITLFIPAGVFMRYVMNDPLQWPEPASVIMMVFFSFIGGAAVYRANQQIAVEALMKAVNPASRAVMQWGVHACMLLIAAFMLGYGVHLCVVTWGNTIAEFPWLSTGVVYMPIPIGGALTLLFIVEKIWLGDPPKDDVMYSDAAADLE